MSIVAHPLFQQPSRKSLPVAEAIVESDAGVNYPGESFDHVYIA
jgi:hypothetical protein